jgi:tetratricopeptide (TPR) repeat protein
MKRLLFSLFNLLLITFLHGQNQCNCEIIDTIKTTNIYQNYIKSKNSICKTYYFIERFNVSIKQQNYPEAEQNILKAIGFLKKSSCDKKVKVSLLKRLDQAYNHQSKFDESLEINLEFLSFFEQQKDSTNIVKALLQIAKIYDRMGLRDQKLSKMEEVKKLIPKIKNDDEKLLFYTRFAQLFLHEYQDTGDKKYLETFELLCNETKRLSQIIPPSRKTQFLINTRLASLHIHKEEWEPATQYLIENLRNCTPDDLPELGINHQDLGEIYLRTGQLNLAKVHLDSSLIYHERLGAIPQMMNGYQIQKDIHEKLGNYKSAYTYSQKYYNFKDSLNNIDNISKIANLEVKASEAESNLTISNLKRNRLFYLLLLALAFGALGILYLYFRQRDLKNKKLILETEQRLNRARMNPHFFFNALASLQSFAINETDNISIAENLSKFSYIMRETLENSYREYVTIHQEIDFLTEYLKLQSMRFPGKFDFQIQNLVESQDDVLIPSMIIQPFIENSIEHGFANIGYKGNLTISFKNENESTVILILDNGRGLNNQIEKSKPYISRAKQIVTDRIYLLNLKLKSNAKFSIENVEGGSGVVVRIELPLIY